MSAYAPTSNKRLSPGKEGLAIPQTVPSNPRRGRYGKSDYSPHQDASIESNTGLSTSAPPSKSSRKRRKANRLDDTRVKGEVKSDSHAAHSHPLTSENGSYSSPVRPQKKAKTLEEGGHRLSKTSAELQAPNELSSRQQNRLDHIGSRRVDQTEPQWTNPPNVKSEAVEQAARGPATVVADLDAPFGAPLPATAGDHSLQPNSKEAVTNTAHSANSYAPRVLSGIRDRMPHEALDDRDVRSTTIAAASKEQDVEDGGSIAPLAASQLADSARGSSTLADAGAPITQQTALLPSTSTQSLPQKVNSPRGLVESSNLNTLSTPIDTPARQVLYGGDSGETGSKTSKAGNRSLGGSRENPISLIDEESRTNIATLPAESAPESAPVTGLENGQDIGNGGAPMLRATLEVDGAVTHQHSYDPVRDGHDLRAGAQAASNHFPASWQQHATISATSAGPEDQPSQSYMDALELVREKYGEEGLQNPLIVNAAHYEVFKQQHPVQHSVLAHPLSSASATLAIPQNQITQSYMDALWRVAEQYGAPGWENPLIVNATHYEMFKQQHGVAPLIIPATLADPDDQIRQPHMNMPERVLLQSTSTHVPQQTARQCSDCGKPGCSYNLHPHPQGRDVWDIPSKQEMAAAIEHQDLRRYNGAQKRKFLNMVHFEPRSRSEEKIGVFNDRLDKWFFNAWQQDDDNQNQVAYGLIPARPQRTASTQMPLPGSHPTTHSMGVDLTGGSDDASISIEDEDNEPGMAVASASEPATATVIRDGQTAGITGDTAGHAQMAASVPPSLVTRDLVDQAGSYPSADDLRPLIPANGIMLSKLLRLVKSKYGKKYKNSQECKDAFGIIGTLVKRPIGDPEAVNWILPSKIWTFEKRLVLYVGHDEYGLTWSQVAEVYNAIYMSGDAQISAKSAQRASNGMRKLDNDHLHNSATAQKDRELTRVLIEMAASQLGIDLAGLTTDGGSSGLPGTEEDDDQDKFEWVDVL